MLFFGESIGATGHQHHGTGEGTIKQEKYTSSQEGKKETHQHEKHDMQEQGQKKEEAMIKVLGNCGMCKNRIEKAAKSLEGVQVAHWNQENEMLHVQFSKTKTSKEAIEKSVAQAGHDTGHFNAPDSVYKELPPCCKYTREQ